MTPQPPTVVPARITAGDSLAWTRHFDGYSPTDGWALSYTAVSASAVFSVTGAADGDSFTVNVAATASAQWTAGTYRIAEVLTNSGTGARVTLGTYTLIVAPDLASATGGLDTRTHAEKMLASIDAWLEKAAPTAGAVEINGRRIQYYPLNDLLAMREKYARMVTAEQTGDGMVRGTRILVRV